MTQQEDQLDESMTTVKTGTCETLTRKSKLTYQVGALLDGEVYLHIKKNSGNGFFSREWITLADIQKTISKIPAGKSVTAIVLGELFQGRSVNTPGFLLAALVEERLLVPMQCRKRSHEPVSTAEFQQRVRQCASGKGKPKAATCKKSARQSPAARKKKARNVRGS